MDEVWQQGGAPGLVLRDAIRQEVPDVWLVHVEKEVFRYFTALFRVIQTERCEIWLYLKYGRVGGCKQQEQETKKKM